MSNKNVTVDDIVFGGSFGGGSESTTPNYTVDTNTPEFKEIESNRDAALDDLEQTYSGMMNQSDAFYQKQIDSAKEWAGTQSALQQERTDFTIEQIEQQKAQAKKDYTKEQSASYVDWQKQSNEYGANAEAMASQGMAWSGYSESAQVSMYNTYQNRVTAARESYNQAVLNYNNAIKDARLANNAALAEIAYQALQKELELSLQGFQYKNQLISDLADKKTETDKYWQTVWNDLLDQRNEENRLNETARQADIAHSEWQKEYELENAKFQYQKEQDSAAKAAAKGGGGSGGGSGGSGSESGDAAFTVDKGSGNTVTTDYYSGEIPYATQVAAQKYGTFSNGYQPKGIAGHGKLKKTGKTVAVQTKTRNGESRTVTQNVWRSESGVLWYWEGREMTYKRVPNGG